MKATLVGLVPGLLVALPWCSCAVPASAPHAATRGAGRRHRGLPVIAYVALNQMVWDRPLWSGVPGSDAATGGRPAQVREFLSYLWQFYLPRLPFMVELQSGLPVFNVWFKGLIGRYGWLDTTFPEWVYTVAVSVFGVVLALAARALWRARAVVSRRGGEVLAYVVLVAGFLLLVGWAGYSGRLANGFIFEQTRYLLPLGALYAALLAVAAKGAGAVGRAVAATLVVLACGHALFSRCSSSGASTLAAQKPRTLDVVVLNAHDVAHSTRRDPNLHYIPSPPLPHYKHPLSLSARAARSALRSSRSTCSAAASHVWPRTNSSPSRDRRSHSRLVVEQPLERVGDRVGSKSASLTGPSAPNTDRVLGRSRSTQGSPQASISCGISE